MQLLRIPPTCQAFSRLRSHLLRMALAAVFTVLFSLNAWTAEMQTVQGHVPAAVARLTPLGTLDETKEMNLAIGLPLRNQAALKQFLADLYNPASPNYRKFLTPAQFDAQFGPTEADYEAVIQFAKANGLTVSGTHASRVVVDVKGSVALVQKALHLTLLTYQHPTAARQFYAPDREPSLDLATPISHISGLNTYPMPHSNIAVKPVGQAAGGTPNNGTGSGPAPDHSYGGGDFRAAYAPGTALTGTGQSVALLEFDGYYASDITAYEGQFGLPNVNVVPVPVDGGISTPGGGNVEVSLDIEMVLAMSPGVSNIYVYECGQFSSAGWDDMVTQMAEDNSASQLSCSWGGFVDNPDTTSDAMFQKMAAQGQSFFCASGDSDSYSGSVPSDESTIPYPCDNPYITTVGGTTLKTTGPLGSFVSETVWNYGHDPSDNNFGYAGSSGGTTNVASYTIPTWQQSVSMATNQGSKTMRNLPDVAMPADDIYVTYGNGSSSPVGGTSCAAPLWAAFIALVNQQAVSYGAPPVGFINPAVYTVGLNSNYASDFHDVTTGNNIWPGSGGMFSAVAGYDLCTGWGSPAGNGLISALGGPFQPTIASFTPLFGNPGDSVVITGTNFYDVTQVAFGGTPAIFTVNSATQITATVPQGSSTGQITVTTAGGTATSSGTFTVHGVTDATLSTLALTPGTLVPAFSSTTTTYTATLSNATTSTTVTATPYNPQATVTGNIGTQPLAVGNNNLSILVTAADGVTTQTYTVVAHRNSADATLSALSLSGIILNPSFASGTLSYTASVPYTTASTQVAATQNYPGATVSGSIGNQPLAIGVNNLSILVTAEDGNTLTYTVAVTRAAPSVNPNLSNLVLSTGTLSPAFSGSTTNYTATVPNATASVSVTPTAVDAVTTIQVNGVTVASGTNGGAAVNLAVGNNTITVLCLAQDGIHTITYTVVVHRNSTDATLAALRLSVGNITPGFSSGVTMYTDSVPYTASSITITATANDPAAAVSGSIGVQSLAIGNNTFNILVIAENGNTKTYTVVVTRAAASTDATLSSLVPSAGTLSPVFLSTTTNYAVSVPGTTTSLTLTPTVNQANATVTVNSVPVTSGSASGALSLNLGSNTESVVVTAQDGVTTKTYTVTVTRLASPVVTTLAQTGLTATTVTLNGTINAVGASTTASFLYGTTTSYGSTAAATPSPVTGSTTTTVSANLTGLKPLTTYHYKAQGVSTAGTGTGGDMQFTTLNNVASLSHLVLSSGPLTPTFKNTTLSYTATVSNTTATVTLTPTTTDANATVTVNGVATLSGSASAPINLNAGSNPIAVVVTAQDGTTKQTYTVTVTRTALPANMNTLPATNLSTTTATLNGSAVANNSSTTLSFEYGTSTAYGKTITATPSTATGTTSTSFSAATAGLTPGTTYHFRAQGVNMDGTATGADTTFTTIDNAAKLSGLKLSNGSLSPAFSSGTKVYAATVANAITSITVKPTVPTASHATVTVNGATVASGSASGAISLAPGPNTITLVVTAQDGVTTGTYTVNVTRTTPPPVVVTQAATSVGSTGAILNATVNASNTSTTPSFQYGLTTSYGSSMAATPSPLTGSTVTPVSATVSGLLPAKTYHYRISAINIGGTSNGKDATFTTPNNVATLSNLVLSTGAMDQSFSPATTSYTQTVSSSTTSLTVTPTITANSKATVTVNSNAVASGKPSTVAVTTGSNTINVVVTAQNGTTTNTYTITVTVPAVPAVVPANSQAVPALTGGALVPIKAQLTGPVANGGVLPGATVTFTWNTGRSVSAYRLSIGTTEGATDLYDGVEGLALTHTVTLPTTGADLYVTLRSMINGTWLANNYLFSAADTTIKAVLLTPADQSVLTAATQTFTWGAVPTAQAYWLSIGSTEGGADLYNASQGTALTQNVTLPTDGRELFVALQTSLNGQWVASNSTLTAAGTGAPVTAQLISPADQSVLLGSLVTFTWEAGAGVSEYWLSLGSSPSATDLYTASQGTNLQVTIAVPTDGSPLYLTLSSLINGQWHSEQYLLQAALPQ